ncbi:uncharacterized protein LOC122535132 isoform X2 [Frieseomelitta varia]|uniref:uncharacterized protein LOC122535132 isoform X2 n=1 Tax=Frieseomelitta varia TaxID=561572 RepID=UPI001CB6982C|nr:uncharacterized protein LOC122535132 isoform X2 [Frieseomelitta varia]
MTISEMEIFGDSSVNNYSLKTINMTPPLEEPKPKNPKAKKKRKVIFSFARRRRSKNKLKKLSKKQNTLETLYKFCKPVVVSVKRLSVSEIKQWCEKDSSPCQVENVSTQLKKSKSKNNVQKSKKFTRKKINNESHLNSKNEMKSPNTLFSQETDIRNKKLLIEDLLRNVKQPYMKLQRIDKVINKIAQSFAKTTTVTECEASIQTECKTNVQTEEIKETINRSIKEIETQAELNVSVPEVQKLPLVNINKDEYPQNPEIEKVAVSFHTNETLQLNECTDSNFISNSDTEIVKNTHKKCFKRKCEVICDSNTDNSNDNANSSEIILNEVKKLRMNLPGKINKMNIVNEKHNIIEAKLSPKLLICGESYKESLIAQKNVDAPLQKLDILKRLASLCDPEDDEYNNDNDDSDNINKNAEKDNTSSSIPSTLNFKSVAEDSASMKVRNDDSIPIEKSILENKEIQESMQELFCSDKNFLQRYKIFKELKVFLIKLDTLKDFHTKHSATEIEKITNKFMNSFVNLNSSKIQHNNQRSIDKISFTLDISKDSNVNFEKSIVCTIPKKMQIISKLPKNSSEKSSSNLIRNMKRKERLKIGKASHNLRKIFDDKSKNRQHVISNLNKNSNVPTPTIKSSLQESSNKTFELSNMIENVNINKSINKMSSLKKQMPEISSTENSVKSVTDARFPEKAEINTPQITNFKSHFSNQSEKLEQTTFVSKTHKKSTNVTATNISASTCYSSTMSLKKPKDKKDTYKCIVCDFCFEDYSNLQQHLIIHTQKQNDSSLNTSNSLAEKSEETISQSSEAEDPELSQMSEHKNVEQASLQCENNKQQKERNTVPRDLLNKKKRKNKIKLKNKSQCTSHSNECSICSKIFPTVTDLAAHIFLHTEKELQQAYKLAKQKLVESENTEREKCKQTRAEQTEQIEETRIEQNLESVNRTVDSAIEGIHEISDKEESFLAQKSNELITKDPEIRDTESTALKKHDSQSIKLDLLSKSSKDKINKIESNKRAFTVCKCHNKSGTNKNTLQIEIVLLCHTCKVLFRSIECFETHYRLPEYTNCNQNRLTSSRSPNLFCANCGMIFSSVQNVRQHLEVHVRFKQNCIMDFRCNICKVIFLGIGTLFYIHWSKHSRNPFWMASEQSFPKHSIINSKLKKIDNLSTQNAMTLNSSVDQYIQVAEHVCNNCKLPFVTQDDLKNHDPRCKEFKTFQDTSVVENSNSHVTIRINCSLCNDTFIDKKREFYNHIKNKHNCNVDPQFVCLSFPLAKVVYICNVCMAMTENLDAFENHWLKHNTTHINFTCTHCNNIYYNNLNSFIDHAEEHKSDTNVVSCTVNYTKAKLVCEFCNTGFESSQDMYEHIVTHNTSNQQTYSKIDQITNQDSPASASQTNCTSSSVKNIGKEIEKSLAMEAQVMEKINEISPLGFNIDKDKEKLIRVLEGSEDDSENELIIDLPNQSEESNEISTGEENREKQTTSNLISDKSSINQTCEMSENNITKTLRTNTNVQVSSQNIPLSEPNENVTDSVFTAKNINPQISLQTSNSSAKSTSVLQNSVTKDVKIIENNESCDTSCEILTGKEEELTTLTKQSPKKQSSPRPKGYLRVKTLAELTGSAHFCKICNCAIENANELAKHFKTHNTSNKDNNDHEIREKELTSKPLETNKFGLYPLSVLKKTLTKSNTIVTNSQKPQQLQINTKQDRHLPSLQNVTSAYHKNLPLCNFVRTTTVMSRSATSKSDGIPIKVTANTSNIPNSHTNMPYEQRTRVTSSINGNKQNPAVMTNSSNLSFCQKQNLEYWIQRKKLEKIDNRPIKSKMDQNSELYQQTIQTRIERAPSSACSQYSSFTAGTSNNSNQMPKQNQAKIVNQPENTSSIYYKSPRLANGGMSIVINQTAPIQNIPTIGILQQPAQQQLYQHQVYSEPVRVMNAEYVQQSQNLVNCSESNGVYQLINNQYELSNRQPNVTAYTVRYVCPYCVKNYTSEDFMQIHINKDHNFVCNICNLRLYNFNDLYLHKLNHNVNSV